MQKFVSNHPILVVIFILVIVTAILCGVFIVLQSVAFSKSTPFADKLWSIRIARKLNNGGYPIHDVSVSDSDPPGFRIIDIQTGNLINGEEQRTYDLVKVIHQIVVETSFDSSFQPDAGDLIMVTLFDDSGIYMIGVDFETAIKYQRNEISEEEYFEKWSFSSNMLEITPP